MRVFVAVFALGLAAPVFAQVQSEGREQGAPKLDDVDPGRTGDANRGALAGRGGMPFNAGNTYGTTIGSSIFSVLPIGTIGTPIGSTNSINPRDGRLDRDR